jgi:hypothetical protein
MILAIVQTTQGFWPHTLGAWAAIAATFTGAGAAGLSYRNKGHIETVRVLVNGQLSQIRDDFQSVTEERDRLKYAKGVLIGGRRKSDPPPLPDVEDDVANARLAAAHAIDELARLVAAKSPPVAPPAVPVAAVAARPAGSSIIP